MAIYILTFFLMVFMELYNFSKSNLSRNTIDKYVCMVCAMLLIILAALRGVSVGTDTVRYTAAYLKLDQYDYVTLYEQYQDGPGYYILSKIFKDIGCSVHVWFGIVELLYISSVYKTIYIFSKDKAFSFIMFFALGYYSFSLSGLKQTLAMGIGLWAFIYLYNRKNIRFFLLLGLSYLCHKSSLILLAIFIILKFRDKKNFYKILVVLFAITAVFSSSIISLVINSMGSERYLVYLDDSNAYAASSTMFLVYLAVFLFALVYNYKKYEAENIREARTILGMAYLGLVALLFAFSIASTFRLSFYFGVFLGILVPNCIYYERNTKNRIIIKTVILSVLLLYFMYVNRNGSSTVPYVFFWQG